jgi:ABC-type bacteriocin/lantibiotic exporter with double-glycine peptidase domain
MINTILKVTTGFNKASILFIILLIITGSIFELLSLGIVIPIISIFSENNENLFFIKTAQNYFPSFSTYQDLILLLIVVIFLIFFFKFLFLVFLTLKINKFIFNSKKLITQKILDIYLDKDYIWHTKNNKSQFINLISNEVSNFCGNALYGLLFITSEIFFFLSIIIFLIFWDQKIFFATIVVSIIFFPCLFYFVKIVSYALGVKRQETENDILVTLNESLNGIKEMILYKWGVPVKRKYEILAEKLVSVSAYHNSFQDIGRHLIEIIGVLLIIFVIYFMQENSNTQNLLLKLGVFGAALFKIMPILNRISTYGQRLKFGMASANKIIEFYKNSDYKKKFIEISFDKNIIFKNVYFKFDGKKDYLLNNLNLEINRNEIIGISGESGSGKTTLTNLIMGLLHPNKGEILVDNKDIIKNQMTFQNQIAFVPQNFFFLDASLLDNITFFDNEINFGNLKFAIKNSLLIETILSKSLSLRTNIGNNALKISGGQLQRINIARALYRNPKVIILDEPTSSLDINNQNLFLDILTKLKKKMTIILITHNDKLLNECDKIYNLTQKRLDKIK